MIKNKLIQILVLVGLSYIFLMLGNGILSLTNPDEVFYVQTAKEMIQHKTWLTPYLFGAPQFEKPILLYWFLRLSSIIFGNASAFASRFFPAFIAIIGVIAVYILGLIGFKNNKKAFIASLVLTSSALYIGLARTVFTDMIFSIFILFALLSFYWGYSYTSKKGWGILLFYIFSALAVLTKGPLGLLIPLLIVIAFLIVKKDIKSLFSKYSLFGLLIFVAIALPWYIFMELKYGASFNREFFYNDHFLRLIKAEHVINDRWYFYPVTGIGAMFPWSLYVLFALICIFKNIKHNASTFNIFLVTWISVGLVIFQFAHSKLTSYIFPIFPALAIITGDFIYNHALPDNKSRIFYTISLIMSAFILSLPVALITLMPRYSVYLGSKIPAYALISLLAILGIFSLSFVLRRNLFKFTLLLFSLPLILLLGIASIHKDIEPFLSSRPACEYLMKNYSGSGPIICSKFYLRGVRFYTDKEVVAVDIPGTNFFSPHPVPFLNSDAKVKEFLYKQPVTYGIIKENNIEDFDRLTAESFKFEILATFGNEYVIRVSAL